MPVYITLVRKDSGSGDEMHITGCADIKRKSQRWDARNETEYAGSDLRNAIIAADMDMAGWFCEEAYTASAAENGCWTTTAQKWAPCFAKAVKAAGIKFAASGEPVSPAPVAAPVAQPNLEKAIKAAEAHVRWSIKHNDPAEKLAARQARLANLIASRAA